MQCLWWLYCFWLFTCNQRVPPGRFESDHSHRNWDGIWLNRSVREIRWKALWAFLRNTIVRTLLYPILCYRPWVQHLKVIRDATPNQYMVLIKFRTQVQCRCDRTLKMKVFFTKAVMLFLCTYYKLPKTCSVKKKIDDIFIHYSLLN